MNLTTTKIAVLTALFFTACSTTALKTTAPKAISIPNTTASAYLQGAIADIRGEETAAATFYSAPLTQNAPFGQAETVPSPLYMRALEKHLLRGDVAAALNIAKLSHAQNGDGLMQWLILLTDAAQRNDRAAVRENLRRAQAHLPELVQLHLIDAYLQVRAGVPRTDALKTLDTAEITAGYQARLMYHKARLALMADDIEAAQNLLEDAQALETGALFTNRLLAQLYAQQDQPDQAAEVLTQFRTQHAAALLLSDVSNADFLAQLGDMNMGTLQTDAAEAFFGLSVLLWAQGAETPARQFMALALALDPADKFKFYYAGVLAESAGQYDLAATYYDAIAATPGLKFAAASRKAATLSAQGDTAAAIDALENTLPQAPTNQTLLAQLAALYEDELDYTAAIKLYNRMAATFAGNTPNHRRSQLLFARGAAHERNQDIAAATEDLEAALALTPDEAMILNYLGYMWVDADMRVEDGLEMLKKAHRLAPRSAAVLDSLGWAYYKLGAYPQAYLYISRAVSYEPEDAVLQDHLGDVYRGLGNMTYARKHWQLALELATRPDATSDVNLRTLRQKLRD